MTFTSYLLLGLATSLHCVAMCGPLVLTYSVKDGAAPGGLFRRAVPHLVYLSAKTASYMGVALVLGSLAALLGGALDIEGIRNWIMVLAGVFMVLLGLSMTGYFPWLRYLTPRPPKFLTRLISRTRRRAIDDSAEGHTSLATPLAFGLLTGFMPCGPLIAAQAGAMASGSGISAATLMLAFGLGTAPLMLAFGLAATYLSGVLRERLQILAAVVVVLFGLVIFNRGLMLVGSPVTFDTVRETVVSGPATTSGNAAGQSTRFALVIRNTKYVPDVVRLPAGVPTQLVVDRQEDNACSDQLAVPQLGVLVDLKPFATTVVDLPAASAGSYTLTCGMGMMSGRIEFGSVGRAVWPQYLALFAVIVLLLFLGWRVWAARRRRPKAACDTPTEGEQSSAGPKLLGFSPLELGLIVLGIAAAALAGYALGGGLRL